MDGYLVDWIKLPRNGERWSSLWRWWWTFGFLNNTDFSFAWRHCTTASIVAKCCLIKATVVMGTIELTPDDYVIVVLTAFNIFYGMHLQGWREGILRSLK